MNRYEELCAAQRAREAEQQSADLELFRGTAGHFPARPEVVGAEQRGLPLPETPEALYATWRAKPESEEVLAVLRRLALVEVRKGAEKIGPRWLWETARGELKKSVDNRLQALACREIEDTTPGLQGRFRHRQRAA